MASDLPTDAAATRARAFVRSPVAQAVVNDDDEAIVDANPALGALLGRDAGALRGVRWPSLLAWPEGVTPPSGSASFSARIEGRRPPWVEGTRTPLGDGLALVTLEELRGQAPPGAGCEVTLDTFPGMAYRCLNDRRWTMQFVSPGALALTGYPASAFVRDEIAYSDLIHPEDVETVWEQVQQALRQREPFALSYRLETRLGQQKWVWEQGQGIFRDGRVVALEGYIMDVTAERRAREALREGREELSRLLDSLGDGVIATDLRGRVTLLNPVAEALTGWSKADALGRPVGEVVTLEPADGDPRADAEGRRVLVDARGRRRPVVHTRAPVRDANGLETGHVLVLRDISERLQTEEALRQAQKLEAVGRLAGGIAHDFNNLLAGIMGYADLLQAELADNEPLAQFAGVILETSRRAAELTSELLAFSRRRKLVRVKLDVHRVIEAAIALLKRTTDPRVAIETRFEAPFATVLGDRTALQSALLNLGLNARDAMPSGGTLTFGTALRELDAAAAARLPPLPPGCYVELTVCDTGPGIPEALLERIFEPFFTSKKTGEGTGLGLAAVYGTVASHGGVIEAGNRPEGGARFRILLPLDTTTGPLATAEGATGDVITGQGLVLLAEDNDMVRRLLVGMLTQLGYTVVEARDGVEAVSLFDARAEDWDLVILDLRMPRMSGEDALARLIERRPDVRILLSSGLEMESRYPPQVLGTLAKPFTLAQLSRSVADAIAG